MIVEAGRRDEAAIAGDSAARAWRAQILAAGIESDPQNFTRFVVITRPDHAPPTPPAAASRRTQDQPRLPHRPPARRAFTSALAAFAERGVNLTKIESRPIPGRPWEYSFYLDFLGDPADPAIAQALASLSVSAESVRILGTYPRGEMPVADRTVRP